MCNCFFVVCRFFCEIECLKASYAAGFAGMILIFRVNVKNHLAIIIPLKCAGEGEIWNFDIFEIPLHGDYEIRKENKNERRRKRVCKII